MKSLSTFLNEGLTKKKAQGPGFTYNWFIASPGTKFKDNYGKSYECVAEINNEDSFIEAQELVQKVKWMDNYSQKAMNQKSYKNFRKFMDDEVRGEKYSHYTLFKNNSGKFGVDASREIITDKK